MKEKKDFLYLIMYLMIGGILLAGFIFCVDPFYHYHRSWFGLPTVMENAVYQTPGAIKHFSYDSVILGTSMTENFHASWFEEMGWETAKFSYSGARTDDLKALLELLYGRAESPAHIVIDINTYQLTEPANSSFGERPEYLYDNSILTDVYYLYNFDVVLESLRRVADGIRGIESNLDDAYTWEDEFYFGKSQVFDSARQIKQQLLEEGTRTVDLEEMLLRCDENLDNIIPFIEAHPETRFYFFYPPYSILYWEQEILKGDLEEMLTVYAHSISRLLVYENVSVYYFQDEFEIISNLDNYRDVGHHRPEYNRYIYECIRDGKKLVTKENLREYIENVYQYVIAFDYDALWKEDTAQ